MRARGSSPSSWAGATRCDVARGAEADDAGRSAAEQLLGEAPGELAVHLALVRLHERAHHLAEVARLAGAGRGDRLAQPRARGLLVGEPGQELLDHGQLGALLGGPLGAPRGLERLDAL